MYIIFKKNKRCIYIRIDVEHTVYHATCTSVRAGVAASKCSRVVVSRPSLPGRAGGGVLNRAVPVYRVNVLPPPPPILTRSL